MPGRFTFLVDCTPLDEPSGPAWRLKVFAGLARAPLKVYYGEGEAARGGIESLPEYRAAPAASALAGALRLAALAVLGAPVTVPPDDPVSLPETPPAGGLRYEKDPGPCSRCDMAGCPGSPCPCPNC